MIIGFDEVPKLDKETKRLVAELGGNKYFDALKELAEYEIIVKASEVINNPSTPNDIRMEQIGRTNGIKDLLCRIREIQQEVFESD
jgi:hypothetical protein